MRKYVFRHWRGNGQVIADVMKDSYRDYPKKSMNKNARFHTLADCIVQVISEKEFLAERLKFSVKAHNDAVIKYGMGSWNLIEEKIKLEKEPTQKIIVPLKRYEKTPLERSLDRRFGYKKRSVLEDVEKTYAEAISKFGTFAVKVETDLVEAQLYKVKSYEIEIINKNIN